MPNNPRNSQDTPGRADPSSSRQQTHPNQGTQTGSPAIDRDSGASVPKEKMHERGEEHYRDRPADEGKHGDGAQTPTPRGR
jgi:hypothetical protein